MKNIWRIVLGLALQFLMLQVQGQNPALPGSFVPNQGQLTAQQSEVAYHSLGGAMTWYFLEDGWDIVLNKKMEAQAMEDHWSASAQSDHFPLDTNLQLARHRIQVRFHGQDEKATLVANQPSQAHHNFYYPHCPQGVLKVPDFQELVYKEVWPGIDIRFHQPSSGGMKYDFVVHPGADPNRISFSVKGAEMLYSEGQITYQTPLGGMMESFPALYEISADGQRHHLEPENLAIDVLPQTGRIEYHIQGHQANQTLVIDPWATFFGEESRFFGVDTLNFKIVSAGYGNSIPINTPGGYNSNAWTGNEDGIIAQFSAEGDLFWSTHYGGSFLDFFNGITSTKNGKIIAYGGTAPPSSGSNDFPVSAMPGYFIADANGLNSWEGVLVQFDSMGFVEFSTFSGGSETDFIRSIATKANGNILIAGISNSDDLLLTGVPLQATKSGFSDIYFWELNPQGQLIWGSFFGGNGDDHLHEICLANNSFALIASTSSLGLATSGAHDEALDGSTDFLIGLFDLNTGIGSRYQPNWITYFGGSGSEGEMGFGVGQNHFNNLFFDGNNSLYVGMRADATGLATPGSYQPTHSGGKDFVIARFSMIGTLQSSSYLGGLGEENVLPVIKPTPNGNVYVAANSSNPGIVFPSGGVQPSKQSAKPEFFIAEFSPDLDSLVCGSYLGEGNLADYTLDSSGSIYCVGTAESSFQTYAIPSPPNMVYQSTISSSSAGFVSKHCDNCGNYADGLLIGSEAQTEYPKESWGEYQEVLLCPETPISFCLGVDLSSLYSDTLWTGMQVNWYEQGSSTALDASHPWVISQSDHCLQLQLGAGDSIELQAELLFGSCTLRKNIWVKAKNPSASFDIEQSSCQLDNGKAVVRLQGFSGPIDYQWFSLPKQEVLRNHSSSTATDSLEDLAPGDYGLWVQDAACSDSFFFNIESLPTYNLSLDSVKPSACGGSTGSIVVDTSWASAPLQLQWYSLNPSLQLLPGETGPILNAYPKGDYLLVGDDGLCQDSLFVSIGEDSPFELNWKTVEPATCCGPTGSLEVEANPPMAYTYRWERQDGLGAWQSIPGSDAVQTTLECGHYRVWVDGGGCETVLSVELESLPGFQISLDSLSSTLCSSSLGYASVLSDSPGTYQCYWLGGLGYQDTVHQGAELFYDGFGSGNFRVLVLQGHCRDSLDFEIGTSNDIAFELTLGNSQCDSANGWASVSTDALNSWLWLNANGDTLGQSDSLYGLYEGQYYIQMSSANCDSLHPFTIQSAGALRATISGLDSSTCGQNNGSAEVLVSQQLGPTLSYLWTPSGQTTALASGLGPGWHGVEINDGSCSLNLEVYLGDSNSLQVAWDSLLNPHCQADNGFLQALASGGSGSYSYQWFKDGVLLSMETGSSISQLPAGNYRLWVDDGDCSVSLDTNLVDLPQVSLLLADQSPARCSDNNGHIGLEAQAAQGEPAFSLYNAQWILLQSGQDSVFSGLDSGCYWLVVEDNYCSDTLQHCLSRLSTVALSLDSLSAAYCGADNGYAQVLASGGSGQYVITWYLNGQQIGQGVEQDNLAPGCYWAVLEDTVYPCLDSLSVCIADSAAAEVALEQVEPARCLEENGSLCVSITGGTGNYRLVWYNAQGDSLGDSTCLEQQGPGNYRLLVGDGNCMLWSDFSLPQQEPLEVTALVNDANCGQDNGSISLEINNAEGLVQVDWYSPALGSGTNQSDLPAGEYCVRVNDSYCVDSLCIRIEAEAYEAPAPLEGLPARCGLSNGMLWAPDSNRHSLLEWRDALGNVLGSQGSLNNLDTGWYLLLYLAPCYDSAWAYVDTYPGLSLGLLERENTSCGENNGYIQLLGEGGGLPYQWSIEPNRPYQLDGDTLTATGLSSGTYTIRIENAYCADSLEVNIAPSEGMEINLVYADDTCGQSMGWVQAEKVAGTAPISYQWSTLDTSSGLQGLAAGNYALEAEDSAGCTWMGQVDVFDYQKVINPIQTQMLYNVPSLPLYPPVQFPVGSSVEPGWSLAGWVFEGDWKAPVNPIIMDIQQPNQVLELMMLLQGPGTCADTIWTYFEVGGYTVVYFPNAFTPNGDMKNETWQPSGIGIASWQGVVYDRWGKAVKRFNALTDTWDGRVENQEPVTAQYTYRFTVTFYNGRVEEYQGSIWCLP